jgi:hypothetical protein
MSKQKLRGRIISSEQYAKDLKMLLWYIKEAIKETAFTEGDHQDNLPLKSALKAVDKGALNFAKNL